MLFTKKTTSEFFNLYGLTTGLWSLAICGKFPQLNQTTIHQRIRSKETVCALFYLWPEMLFCLQVIGTQPRGFPKSLVQLQL